AGADPPQTKGRIKTAVRMEAINFRGPGGTGQEDAAIGLKGDRGYDGKFVERLVAGASGEGLIQAAVRVVACDHVRRPRRSQSTHHNDFAGVVIEGTCVEG